MLRVIIPDAMRHVQAWLDAAGIAESRSSAPWARVPICAALDPTEAPTHRTTAKAAGLAPDEVARISGHSTRVGATCDLVRYGQQIPASCRAGGCPARYSARLTMCQNAAPKWSPIEYRLTSCSVFIIIN